MITILDAPALATLTGWTLWSAVRSVRQGRPDEWAEAAADAAEGP